MNRLSYPDPADVAEAMRKFPVPFRQMRIGRIVSHAPTAVDAYYATYAAALQDLALDAKLRELAILRVAWRTGSGYEWRAHLRMGAEAGLSAAQLDAIADGPAAEAWSPLESALLRATDEMIDQHRVGDETWGELTEHFDPAELLELLFVVGGYLCLAAVLNSAGLVPKIADP